MLYNSTKGGKGIDKYPSFRKGLAVGIILLLLMVSSFVGVSKQTGYASVDTFKSEIPNETSTNNGPMNSSWPMYCHDVRHTGRSQYSTTNNLGNEKWRFKINDMSGFMVIAYDGTIYTGGQYLYAINPNGTLKWKYDTRGVIASCPALDENGTIYVGTTQSNQSLYAMNPDGTVKWIYPVGQDVFSSPALGNDGSIYFGAGSNIYALYPNGTQKWVYLTGKDVHSSPAISSDGTIFCSSDDNNLYALYPTNGTVKWVFSAGVGWDWPVKSPTIADDGTIYFGSSNGTLYALSANGTVKWSFNGCVGDPNGRPTPILSLDGTIYVCNVYYLNSSLYALYPMNGSIKWRVNLAEEFIRLTDLVVSADGTIYFGIDYETGQKETEIIALNSNGTEKWRIPFSYYYVHGSLAIAKDGVIYLGTTEHESNSGGYLHAFGPGVMKKIEIIQPKLGHFYFFGRDLGVTKNGHTIVIGDIDIKLNMYDEQNITSVTYTLNNINNSYSYTATQPPFDWIMNKRYSQSIVYHIYVVAVADFQGGCQWTDGMLGFWYIHFLKN